MPTDNTSNQTSSFSSGAFSGKYSTAETYTANYEVESTSKTHAANFRTEIISNKNRIKTLNEKLSKAFG